MSDNQSPVERSQPSASPDVGGATGYASLAPEPTVRPQGLTSRYTVRIVQPNFVLGDVAGTVAYTRKLNLSEFAKINPTVKQLASDFEEYSLTKVKMEITSTGPMATTSGAIGVTMIQDPAVEPPTAQVDVLSLAERRTETMIFSAKQQARTEYSVTNGVLPGEKRFCRPGVDSRLSSYGSIIVYTAAAPTGTDVAVLVITETYELMFYKPTRTPTTRTLTTKDLTFEVITAEHEMGAVGEQLRLEVTVTGDKDLKDTAGRFICLPSRLETFVLVQEETNAGGTTTTFRESVQVSVSSCAITVTRGTTPEAVLTGEMLVPMPRARNIIVRDPDGVEFAPGLTLNGYIAYQEHDASEPDMRIISPGQQSMQSMVTMMQSMGTSRARYSTMLAGLSRGRRNISLGSGSTITSLPQ